MASKFHPLRIRDVRRETDDCVSISFDVPLALKDRFQYRPGQNLTIRIRQGDTELRRSYSICSSPLDDELRIAVKEIPGGVFSRFANRLAKVGDELDVMPPAGSFHVQLEPASQRSYLAFAAGSGITPILSIIKTTLALEPASRFTLVYGNQSRNSIIFRESLETLKNQYIERFQLIHILSREEVDSPVSSGRINAEKCRQMNGKLFNVRRMDHVFLCGPFGMIESLRDWLQAEGVPSQQIHFELFNTPVSSGTGSLVNKPGASPSDNAEISVQVDGRKFRFSLDWNGISVLDAALAAGADLPYACKGGVCATCKARLIGGQVTMESNYALEAEELAAGFILTCQSHPASPVVEVDFDAK